MKVLLWLLALALSPLAYGQRAVVAEQYLLSAVNQERAAHDLAPVRLDATLCRAALGHAQRMAARGDISHQFAGEPELAARGAEAGARFSRITENVGEGPSIVQMHEALMRSPGHRRNILDAEVDAVGIAVLLWNGQLYAVEDFQTTVRNLTLGQQEAVVGMALDALGVEMVPSEQARETCAMDAGYAGEYAPAYVIRYTTDDLTKLPARLTTRLSSGREHRAAVGACVSNRQSSFSEYRIAVLLYR